MRDGLSRTREPAGDFDADDETGDDQANDKRCNDMPLHFAG
jgi:hypothetical protein